MRLQGMLFAGPDCAKNTNEMLRLWLHEAERVYKDKLVEQDDIVLFDKIVKETIKKNIEVKLL
jgi:dynein heavy chain